MVMTYDEYLKKNKKKKKEEPKVVLGYSNKNNVNNSPKSTTNTQTLIDKYVAEQKAKKDIAPVRTTVTTPKKPAERTWFQAGAFSDGYDFGDVAKTITGTTADVGLGITKGVFNLAEGIVDLGRYGVSGVANVLGAKEYAKDVKKTAQENTTEKWFSPIEKKIDKNSLIGEKGDTISEGLGYVASMIATGGVGGAIGGAVSGGAKAVQIGATLGTTGVTFTSAMGSGMSEAYEGGASDEEAVTYGAISGIAEAGTELIFGGLGKSINAVGLNTGLSSADDMLAKKVSEIFKKQVSKNIAETGIKMGAEGTEEVIAGILQAVGQKVTYKSEEELMQIINDQELLESFISGAVVSGIAQAPSVVRDTKAGRDYVTGYTQQEQQAIDKVVNERITEQERQGITLTKKEKNAIIEQTTKEFNEFKEKVKEIAPVKDDVRSQDIAPVKQAGTQDAPVNERQQNYVSEAKETDSVYRKNLNEDASKYANNSKRTHEFVNTLSNISEATGENIRLTNNTSEEMVARRNQLIERYAKKKNISVEEATAKLKDTVIDAYNTGDGITINVNSPKALNRLVGHEITHSLEKTAEYNTKLQKIAIEYAKTKGEYNDRVEILESLYDGTNADINKELTADIVGDYLFTDQEFINNIQKKDRNLFQRIYDEIKHLIKLVTANTKEARQLEQLKHSFEKAMAEHKSDKTNKVTVQETKSNSSVEVESNTQEKENAVQKVEEEYSISKDNKDRELSEEQKEFFKDSKVRDEDGNLLTVYHGTKSEFYTFNNNLSGDNYEGWSYSGKGFYFTDDIKEAQEFGDYSLGDNDTQIKEVYLNITNPFDTSTTDASVLEKLSEGYDVDNQALIRGDFLLRWFRSNKINASEVLQKNGYDGIIDYGHYVVYESNQIKEVTNKKPTLDDDIRYSLSDNKGYHYGDLGKGRDTYYWNMSQTRRSTGHFGTGTYFFGDEAFSKTSLKSEGRPQHSVDFSDYNLFKPSNTSEATILHDGLKTINNYEYNSENYKYQFDEMAELLNSRGIDYYDIYGALYEIEKAHDSYTYQHSDYDSKLDSLSTIFMKELGFNGIDVRGIDGYDNGSYGSVIYDLNKKSSNNINYSLSSVDSEGKELSKEQVEFFEDSKVRDAEGRLKVVYHGTEAMAGLPEDAWFTVFDTERAGRNGSLFGAGFYFTDSKEKAQGYAHSKGKVYETYLNIKNPFKPLELDLGENIDTFYDIIEQEFKNQLPSDWGSLNEYQKGRATRYILEDNGYDGVFVGNTYVAFNSNQIKNVDNTNPTESDDIRYSLSDSKGRELTKEQQNYFKDSKLRDENGNLKVMYHGTPYGGFNIFELNGKRRRDSGFLGEGFYFTDDLDLAREFSDSMYLNDEELTDVPGEFGNIEVKEVYLDVKNPYIVPDGIDYGGGMLNDLLGVDRAYQVTNKLKSMGYDGVIYKNGTEVLVFNPNQIKNVTNTNPTSDPDIRYSLSDNKDRELSKKQQEYFKNSKVRDENGKLLTMYHGGYATTEFTRGNGEHGPGYYFTPDYNYAESYGNNDGKTVTEAYLKIENPLEQLNDKNAKELSKFINFVSNTYNIPKDNVTKMMSEYDWTALIGEQVALKEGYSYQDVAGFLGWDINDVDPDDVNMKAYLSAYAWQDVLNQKARELGYDGIISRVYNDDTNFEEYIAFNSNQIKSVDNTSPTDDADIRYSLSSTGEMVDNQGNKVTLEASETGSTRNLMAIHNLDEGKLRGVIELGGFPVPSIAIIDTNKMAHNQFGGISVLFDKETINPANPKNEVYDRDVWTPTFPKVEYDIDSKVLTKIKKATNVYSSYGDNTYLSHVASKLNNLEDAINTRGLEEVIKSFKQDISFKYAYLKQINPEFKEVMRPYKYAQSYSNETLQKFLDLYDGKYPLNNIPFDEIDYYLPQMVEAYREQLIKEYKDNGMDKDTVDKLIEIKLDNLRTKFYAKDNFLTASYKMQKEGANKQVISELGTNEQIVNEINQNEFEKWIDDLFEGIVANKGIYNGKDYITDTGRRTFKQTHEPYTLESVVKYITKQKTVAGEEGWGAGSGFGTIQAQMSHKFNSIDEIKQYGAERLTNAVESSEFLRPLAETIYEDMGKITEYHNTGDEYYYSGDAVGYALNDFAGYKTQNITNLKKALDNNSIDSSKIPTELLQKVVDDINALKNIPTDYFEAKPQRAVGLDEVQAVVIPNYVSPEFKQQLQDAGLTYYEYDSSIEGDRQRVINQFDDLKFSLSRTTDDIAPVKDADVFGRDITLQEAIAPLQEQVKELTKAITDLQENIAPASMDLVNEEGHRRLQEMTDEDAPVDEGLFTFLDNEVQVKKKQEIVNEIASDFSIKKTEARELYNKIESIPEPTIEDVRAELEAYREIKFQEEDDYVKSIQDYIRGTRLDISEIKKQIPDYGNKYRMSNMGKGLILGNSGQKIDAFYQELSELYPNEFPATVTAEADQLELISDAMYKEKEFTYTDIIDDDELQILAERIYSDIGNHERYRHAQSGLYFLNKELKNMTPPGEADNDIPVASNTKQTGEIAPVSRKLKQLNPEATVSETPVTEGTKITKSKWRNVVDTTQRLFVNEMVETDNLAKESGNLNIKYTGDMLNSVAGEIEGEIYTAQTDNEGHAIGKSLSELFAPAKEKGLYDAFNDYLEHYSNIDRHAQGKGSKTPLNVSQTLVKAYEKSYPEFKQWGKDVWKYGANVRQNLIDAGIISEEHAEALGTMYPHYVPYMENREMSNYNPDLGEIKPKGVIKRAKGGAKNLLPIEEALTKYTFGYKKAVRQNQFYQEIIKTLGPGVDVGADVRNDAIDFDDTLYKDETGNYLTAYVDGERISTRITDDLYTGLKNDLSKQIKGLEEKYALITEPVQKLSEIRRNLLTSWNPMFIIKNPIMDIQDALFNSKYTKDFIKHYNIPTFIELGKASTETARQFLTLYGSGNVMGEHSSDGTVKKTKGLKWIQKANNVMELAPRYAEFKASLDNGASIQEAMYNAREVTTNFSRGGTITKALNKNGFTFLNVSVQGFDKFIRNFSGENGAKGVAGALLKATLLGVVPALFNDLLFGGDDEDEEYEALPDYIKDNYYLFKTGEGEFIRIPKGRMLSVFGSAGRRTLEFMQGEEDAFEGFLKNANSQVGISNPLDSNILTPLIQAYGSENGEAWFGGDLVPSRLQKKAPEEQYDATTDKMSIWLGDKLGISPYKLNYVLDQYSGGIGDMFLPIITEESTSDVEGLGMVLAPIKDQFTANSTSDNKYAGEIYDLSDKMDKMPEATKETDEYKVQDAYLYSVTSEMGKLYEERRQVQADKDLSKSEKYKKVQAIQKQINDLAKEGMENYQNVSKSDVYAIVGGREFNKYTTDDGTERWGSVFEDVLEDLNSLGMDLDEKSEYFRATSTISTIQDNYKNLLESASDDEQDVLYAERKKEIINVVKEKNLTGEQKAYLYDKYYGNSDVVEAMVNLNVDIDSFLDYEAQNFTADKYANGKTVPNSKKRKVFNYINSMPIEFEQRLVLAKLQYPSYNEYNPTIIEYLNNSEMTYEQVETLLTKMNFKVDENGNIRW